jgi:hypothetical protein
MAGQRHGLGTCELAELQTAEGPGQAVVLTPYDGSGQSQRPLRDSLKVHRLLCAKCGIALGVTIRKNGTYY